MCLLLKPASYTASVMSPTYGDISHALHNPNHMGLIKHHAIMVRRAIEHEWINYLKTKALVDIILFSTSLLTITLTIAAS